MLKKLKAAISVINYLNFQGVPNANGRLTTIINDIGTQWGHGQATYNQANPGDQVTILEFWREWNRDFFGQLIRHTKTFCQDLINEMRKYWGVTTGNNARHVLEDLRSMEAELENLTIDMTNFD